MKRFTLPVPSTLRPDVPPTRGSPPPADAVPGGGAVLPAGAPRQAPPLADARPFASRRTPFGRRILDAVADARTLLGAHGAVPGRGDKSAFHHGGDTGRAVLCLHGFTGTPFEVRPLAEGLAHLGYTVGAPLLAGHGESPEALAKTGWRDWLASAEAAFDALRAEAGGRPVAIAGFSMGGLLALELARTRGADVAALALLAVPLRLRTAEALAVRIVSRLPSPLRRGPLRHLPKRRGFDVTDEEMRRQNPSLPVLPVAGVASLLALGDLVRPELPSITAPALVAHGTQDGTVPLEDSLELVGCLGSERIERLWLERSGHLLAIDVERAALVAAIDRFFASVFSERLGAARARGASGGKASTSGGEP